MKGKQELSKRMPQEKNSEYKSESERKRKTNRK